MTTKGKSAALKQSKFVMSLKRNGKGVTHFVTGSEDEMPSAFKDGYMPNNYFDDLGKPQEITVTIVAGNHVEDE